MSIVHRFLASCKVSAASRGPDSALVRATFSDAPECLRYDSAARYRVRIVKASVSS